MGTAFLYGSGGSGGTGATLTVTALAGCTVTVSKDGKTKTKTAGADGLAVFKGLATGTWTVTITNGTDTSTDTVDLVADYTKAMSFAKIYGIRRDITASSPVWARTDDAAGKTATASVGTVAGHSDFDNCYPWSGIHRETLPTGDVMVKIPKFWFQRYREGNVEYIKIADKAATGFTLHPAFKHGGVECDHIYVGAYKTSSNNKSVSGASPQVSQTRATFRTNAKAKGDGWGLIDIDTLSAIQMLMLVEYSTNNVQDKSKQAEDANGNGIYGIGLGYTNASNSTKIKTGSCDSVPNLTGIPAGTGGKVDVVWRGIEGLWGNTWEWVDGVNVNNGIYYVCNDPSKYADNTSDGYIALSFGAGVTSGSLFITQVGLDTGENNHIMLPSSAVKGSETTYYCDAAWFGSGWRVFHSSGTYNGKAASGIFTASLDDNSDRAEVTDGARLLYIPQ